MDDDLLERCDRWLSAMLKGQKLLLVFFAGMIFALCLMLACYLTTGGK